MLSIRKTTIFLVCSVLICLLQGCVTIKSPAVDMATQEMIDRGVAFMEHKQWELAEASFRVAVEAQQVPQAYDGLGCVALARGDIRQARKFFHDILEWFPDYEPVYWHLAYLEEQEGNLLLANEWHKKAVGVNPVGYKEKNNYALFLQDRAVVDKSDNFSKDLSISYLDDATAITGTKHPLKTKDTFRYE